MGDLKGNRTVKTALTPVFTRVYGEKRKKKEE